MLLLLKLLQLNRVSIQELHKSQKYFDMMDENAGKPWTNTVVGYQLLIDEWTDESEASDHDSDLGANDYLSI